VNDADIVSDRRLDGAPACESAVEVLSVLSASARCSYSAWMPTMWAWRPSPTKSPETYPGSRGLRVGTAPIILMSQRPPAQWHDAILPDAICDRILYNSHRQVLKGPSRGRSRLVSRLFEQRPWGSFTVIEKGTGYQIKRIEVVPGRRLSYQTHGNRAEHWVVAHGVGKVTLNGREFQVEPGSTVDVPIGAAHRIENTGTENLLFIEVQLGSYLGEDDIVRLQDDFGRG
jgi:mannose-6-phosphate isomerase